MQALKIFLWKNPALYSFYSLIQKQLGDDFDSLFPFTLVTTLLLKSPRP